jgi:hypothetical protein
LLGYINLVTLLDTPTPSQSPGGENLRHSICAKSKYISWILIDKTPYPGDLLVLYGRIGHLPEFAAGAGALTDSVILIASIFLDHHCPHAQDD